MEVSCARQCFVMVNGSIEFVYTRVLFNQDGVEYFAKSLSRNPGLKVAAETLKDIQPIPPEAYRPLLPPASTIALEPSDYYIKQPNLMAFDGGLSLASIVLQELATCEVIRKHPHPNIAIYHGCVTSDGRVIGLCFKK